MIEFHSEYAFELENKEATIAWLTKAVFNENKELGDINYIFCDDAYLHKINVDFLNHDTLTDIISFDYTLGNTINGDIYISIERVLDNARDFKTEFVDELDRVMIHGILHYCGYKDKSDSEAFEMRAKENHYLNNR